MNVTSLETSRAIYEALGWDDSNLMHDEAHIDGRLGPFYDLSYLLERLPKTGRFTLKKRELTGWWFAKWDDRKRDIGCEDESPVEAVGLLIIRLKANHVLKKEATHE